MRPTLALLLSILATATSVLATEPLVEHPTLGPATARWVDRMELFDVPGAAIVVIEDDRTWVGTWGIRDHQGRAVDVDTMFYIASITKTYLATLAALLAEDGSLMLDDPVRQHLPRLQLADEAAAATLTVRDLLAHRPGIRSGEIVLLDAYTGEITDDRYYHWLERADLHGETLYSNVHFTLAGRVVEEITAKDWRDALAEHLLRPAGLDRTTGYASRLYGDENAAVPLERSDDVWHPVEQRKTDRTMHAAGGLATTAADAARYLRLHLGEGELEGQRVFSEATAREIRREHSTHKPQGSLRVMTGFGLGWERGLFNGVPILAHGGGYSGASAYFALLPASSGKSDRSHSGNSGRIPEGGS